MANINQYVSIIFLINSLLILIVCFVIASKEAIVSHLVVVHKTARSKWEDVDVKKVVIVGNQNVIVLKMV